jgi:hypothetical protein
MVHPRGQLRSLSAGLAAQSAHRPDKALSRLITPLAGLHVRAEVLASELVAISTYFFSLQ